MFENRRLFNGLDPKTGKYGNRFHLASIVGLWDLLPSSSSGEASVALFTSMTEVST